MTDSSAAGDSKSPAGDRASVAADGKHETKGGHGKIVNRPTMIEHNNHRFLIMDAPTDANLPSYIEVLVKKNVQLVVRACEPSYSTAPLIAAGMKVVELPFTDGDPPPENVVSQWLTLVDGVFSKPAEKDKEPVIAVHCVAGLGRAPVLVAVALVEAGMEPLDAIAFIRKKRRGAINARQIKYIENYKRRKAAGCCIVM